MPAIDNKVIDNWKVKGNKSIEGGLGKKTEGKEYSSGFFACLAPPDLCCMTCCCPCITFGKTYHRIEHNGDMSGYEPINTSCLLFLVTSYFGVGFLFQAVQASEFREKHGLRGSCVGDLLKSCCCLLCSLVQTEKESKLLLEGQGAGVVNQQYQAGPGADNQMVMQPQAVDPAAPAPAPMYTEPKV